MLDLVNLSWFYRRSGVVVPVMIFRVSFVLFPCSS
jgi:hypothetical protein